MISVSTQIQIQMTTLELAHTSVFLGAEVSDPGSGITQGQADARYVKLSQINAANGVAGLDANSFLTETQLPLPPVDLSILFANKIA